MAAFVAAALADGVVHTSSVLGSRAQSVPAATSRVASTVDGPPALKIEAVSSGGRPPDRGIRGDDAVGECDVSNAAVACRRRRSMGVVAFGGNAHSKACRYSRQKAWSGHGESIAMALRAQRRVPPFAAPRREGDGGGEAGGDAGGDGGGEVPSADVFGA